MKDKREKFVYTRARTLLYLYHLREVFCVFRGEVRQGCGDLSGIFVITKERRWETNLVVSHLSREKMEASVVVRLDCPCGGARGRDCPRLGTRQRGVHSPGLANSAKPRGPEEASFSEPVVAAKARCADHLRGAD